MRCLITGYYEENIDNCAMNLIGILALRMCLFAWAYFKKKTQEKLVISALSTLGSVLVLF